MSSILEGFITPILSIIKTLLSNNLKVQGYDVRNKEDFPSVQSHFLESKRQFINNNNQTLTANDPMERSIQYMFNSWLSTCW